MKKITFRHFERLLTCQKYFIWNVDIEKEINTKNDEELDENSIWEIVSDFDIDDLKDYKFVEIIKNGFDFVNQKFLKYIDDLSKKENKKYVVINEKNNELSFNKTLYYLNDENIDWIVNPVFIFDNLISRCSLYKKKERSLFTIIHASKTKLKNYIKAYFDYNVLMKLNIEINEYYFFVYDNEKDYIEKNDLTFKYSLYCWTQKNGPSKETKQTIEENCDFETIVDKIKSGNFKYKKIYKKNKIEKEVLINLKTDDFDAFINDIEKARNITKKPNHITENDITLWGTNPNILDIFNFDKHCLKKVSGYLLDKKNLLEIENGTKSIEDFKKEKLILKYVLENINKFNEDEINKSLEKVQDKKVVWYDFEGFSMPYAILPHTKPYQQLIFQLSIIKTDKEEIISKENIVIDPKKLDVNNFVDFINKIYWEQAQTYVVYNKGYELSKLNDMINLISQEEKYKLIAEELKNKLNKIKELTFDLWDLFKVSKNCNNIPPIFISDLLGFSSIKKLEKYITENNFKLDVMITPYKSLEIQNGLMAMNKAIQRYIGAIGDNEWNKIVENLKQYCENDVKAMIMVYLYIKTLKK